MSGGADPVALGGMLARRELVAGAALLPAALLTTSACAAGMPNAVSLPDFRQSGDPDDTAALARAFASGRPVHAPAGRGSGPGGRYLVGNEGSGSLPAGAILFGDGREKTVIARAGTHPFVLHCDSGSPDPARNISGLRFRDLTFMDDVERLGFSEYSYLVMLNGVSDARFDRVGFRGFRGDGLHLGSSTTRYVERHNQNVVVSDCVFDGVNANNRNAISIIDGDSIIIEKSQFLNVTRPGDGTILTGDPMDPATGLGQPGAIDLEPNGDAFAVIRNVTIRGNLFAGGGGFAVNLLLPPADSLRIAPQGIVIEHNVMRDRAGAFQALGYAGDGALTSKRAYQIAFRDNQVDRCNKPFIVSGMRGVTLSGNQFRDCRGHAEVGNQAANAQIMVADNLFERVGGLAPGFALWLRTGTDIALVGNRFIDAGVPGGKGGVAIAVVAGTLRGLTLRGNQFRSVEGRMNQSAILFKDARVDPGSFRLENNDVLGPPLAQALNPLR
jgi:hypothetical protein